MERYSPQDIESKWQKKWEEGKVYKTETDASRPKYYAFEMFPYPSGNLHYGHAQLCIGDVMARYKTMVGLSRPAPDGLRLALACGRECGHQARRQTGGLDVYSNIENMEKQQKKSASPTIAGTARGQDGDPCTTRDAVALRSLSTKRGRLQEEGIGQLVRHLRHGLANEQVIDGKCWRCDHEAHKKDLAVVPPRSRITPMYC